MDLSEGLEGGAKFSNWQSRRGARTGRGEQRRAELLAAAKRVFSRKTYDEVKVSDITREAGAAHGTFYKYFQTKEAVFGELLLELQDEILGRGEGDQAEPASRRTRLQRIEDANRRFLLVFRRYANIMVAADYSTAPQIREVQDRYRGVLFDRIERSISAWQSEGHVDPQIDAHYAAYALGSMVNRFAYMTYVLGEDFDTERAVQQLTLLWANALGLRSPR